MLRASTVAKNKTETICQVLVEGEAAARRGKVTSNRRWEKTCATDK